MAQQVKVIVAKTQALSLIPRSHMTEGKHIFSKVLFSNLHAFATLNA